MTKRWFGMTVAAIALAASATAGYACDREAKVAEAKNPAEAKDVKAVAATADAKGCDKPCCAHAKDAADEKLVANAAAAKEDKPCAAHDAKGCPKKVPAALVAAAPAQPAADTAKAEPVPDPGTQR